MTDAAQVQTVTPHQSHTTARPESKDDVQSLKRRAACDDCRAKKLKCSGDRPTCSRCTRDGTLCVYSPPKRMGRPKKLQRGDDEALKAAGAAHRLNDRSAQYQAWGAGDEVDMASMDTSWPSTAQWDASMPPGTYALPGLTPDCSTASPQTLPLLPELPTAEPGIHHHHRQLPMNDSLPLVPSLPLLTNLTLPLDSLPACACISTMYLTFSSLQSLPPSPSFPFALQPLRTAKQTAHAVIACQECPKRFLSAMQSTSMLGTLLMSIAERFGKLLQGIASESERARTSGERKRFQLADLGWDDGDASLYSYGEELRGAAAFSVDLEPNEWRALAKKVVKAEVKGPVNGLGDGEHPCPSLVELIAGMKERHESGMWQPLPNDFPRDAQGKVLGGRNIPREDHTCLKLVAYATKVVEGFDWS